MSELIQNDSSKCVGCNKCIRVCPIEGANVSRIYPDGRITVDINSKRCISCGLCVKSCHHDARSYVDNTKQFFEDLKLNQAISCFAAPAFRSNFPEWERMISWLQSLGVRKIYDVSLGADICTWAHIRYIQKYKPKSVITQPCPAIVNFILMHHHELLPYLSPIHSPMLCTAIYMRKYEGVDDKIAALSPCIAKTDEFTATGFVDYNITFKKLAEYIKEQKITLPTSKGKFDHYDCALGSIYSMPGGLKENVEFYLGKALRVDKSEGQDVVYNNLEEFGKKDANKLPAVFDVLNCPEGCNMGTGCLDNYDIFDVNTVMDAARTEAIAERDDAYFENLFAEYDKELKLEDFIRVYEKIDVQQKTVLPNDIEQAFKQLNKSSEVDRSIDCGACGASSCMVMARRIALGYNIPHSCITNAHFKAQERLLEVEQHSSTALNNILCDINKIKETSNGIGAVLSGVSTSIAGFRGMADSIAKIAKNINLISLNASIESARAGSYGKTFSVVAQEVRTLADKTQEVVGNTESLATEASDATGSVEQITQQIRDDITQVHETISNVILANRKMLNNISVDSMGT